MQVIQQQIDTHLHALKQANHALHELTTDLSLLSAINEMTINVATALELLLEQSAEESNVDDFVLFLAGSESIEALDDIVDADAVSELENQFFNAIDSMEDDPMGEFLAELIEKIELRYTCVVDAIHELNALLNPDE